MLPSFEIKVPNTRDARALTAVALQSKYRLTEKALELSALDLTLDDTHVRGSLAIDDLDTMALSFNLAVDSINVTATGA